MREEEPKIRFVVNPPGNPNSAGFVENNNRVVRGVMRRYTRAHMAQQAATAKKSESYWYGQGGRTLQQINSLVNSRPVREIGYRERAVPRERAQRDTLFLKKLFFKFIKGYHVVTGHY